MSANLKLDKFELMWLFEGAAGKSHLRWGVYEMFIDKIYPQLDCNEREFLYTYIKRDTSWLWEHRSGLDSSPHNYWLQVLARFNPSNQYRVTATHDGHTETKDAYKFNGKYYTNSNRYFADEYITDVVHLEYKKCQNHICGSKETCLRFIEFKDGDKLLNDTQWHCPKCDLFISRNGDEHDS